MGEYIFKFGMHKDKPMSQVPDSYLDWGMKNFNPAMADKCVEELQRREHSGKKVENKTPSISKQLEALIETYLGNTIPDDEDFSFNLTAGILQEFSVKVREK